MPVTELDHPFPKDCTFDPLDGIAVAHRNPAFSIKVSIGVKLVIARRRADLAATKQNLDRFDSQGSGGEAACG